MAARRALVLDPRDSVANVLEPVAAGETITARVGDATVRVVAREAIPFGFKVALADLPAGAPVLKYGATIGRASRPIRRGDLVHVHNLEGGRARGDLGRRG